MPALLKHSCALSYSDGPAGSQMGTQHPFLKDSHKPPNTKETKEALERGKENRGQFQQKVRTEFLFHILTILESADKTKSNESWK